MIIEFTGCTGAGKSTAIGELIRRNKIRGGVRFLHAYDAVLISFGIRISNYRLRSVIVEVVVLPLMFVEIIRQRTLIWLVLKYIGCNRFGFFMRLNVFRNFVKSLGVKSFLSNTDRHDRCAILDEGTFHVIHNIFVNHVERPDIAKAKSLVGAMAKGELLVVILSSASDIADRQVNRGDPPVKGLLHQQWLTFAENANSLYVSILKDSASRYDAVIACNSLDEVVERVEELV